MNERAAAGHPPGYGDALLQLLRGQPLEGFEKSFKLSERNVLSDRFLVGIHKSDLSPAALFALCARMGLPERYVAPLIHHAEEANAFHFGFEGSGRGGIYKVYLEFAGRLPQADEGQKQPVLLHLAYKWEVEDVNVATIARYDCHPGISLTGITEKVAGLYGGHHTAKALEPVMAILATAASRTSEPMMYLQVSEENNPRASFDIKLHGAGMRVSEIEPWLSALREQFDIPEDRLAPLLAQIKDATVGHLSGGINREGKEFLTIYHDAKVP